MKPDDVVKKAQAMRRLERAANRPRWFYLSFATGTDFLGGLHLKAYGPSDAILLSHERKLNPGGAVLVIATPPGFEPPAELRDRLLTKEEVEAFDRKMSGDEPPLSQAEQDAALANAKAAGEALEVDDE